MSKIIFGVLFATITSVAAVLAIIRICMTEQVTRWFAKECAKTYKIVSEEMENEDGD